MVKILHFQFDPEKKKFRTEMDFDDDFLKELRSLAGGWRSISIIGSDWICNQ